MTSTLLQPVGDVPGDSTPFGGQGNTILAIVWVEMVIATALIVLRFYTRYCCGRPGGWGLHWASWSWLVGFLSQIFISVAVIGSLRPTFNMPGSSWTVPRSLMWTWVSIILTFLAIGLSKIAVVAFILAIQAQTHQRMRYFLHFVAWSNMLLDTIFVFYLMFRCHPSHAIWNINDPVKCHSNFASARNLGYAIGAYNAATDLFLALYPLVLFRHIQISKRAKLGLNIVMSLGIITAGCAAVKTWHIRHVTSTTHLTYELFCLIVWTFTEMWAVLICSSVPPLWPLAKLWYGNSAAFRSRTRTLFSVPGSDSGSRRSVAQGVMAFKGFMTPHSRTSKSMSRSCSRSKSWQRLVMEKPVTDLESGHQRPASEHYPSISSRERDDSPTPGERYELQRPEKGLTTTRDLVSPPPPFAGYSRTSSDGKELPPPLCRTGSNGNEIPLPEKAIIMTTDIEISCEQRTAEDGSVRGREGFLGTGKHDAWMKGDDDILPFGARRQHRRGDSSHSEKRRK